MEQVEAILLKDVYSVFYHKKERIRLGGRGEKVKRVSDHGNVWIVKGRCPDPFSVNVKLLKITNE